MKEWCKAGCLPDDRELAADLSAVEYGYDAGDAILLERKEDMKRRGLASTDDALLAGRPAGFKPASSSSTRSRCS
jgi:hypothetical protein